MMTLLALLPFVAIAIVMMARYWRRRVVAEERARLALEIHDTLSPSFAGIGFQLQAIRNSIPPHSNGLERQVDLAIELTRRSHDEARRSIARLHPESLGGTGLLYALRTCAERMVHGGVTVETCGEEVTAMPAPVKEALFRIGQEAIANSIRHAGPTLVRIRLQNHRSSLYFSVEDDGAGFVEDGEGAGLGLRGMRLRAESISARLVIRSAPGSGTRVEVRAPLKSRFEIAHGGFYEHSHSDC